MDSRNKFLVLLGFLVLLTVPHVSALCIPFLQDCSQNIILINRGSNEDVNYTWLDTMEFAFEQPAKNVDVEIIGAELIISSSSSISSGSPINISTGISKLKLEVLSGADTIGDITINAVKHDRDTGITTEPFSETLALNGVTDTNMTTEWIGNKTVSNDINLTTTNFDGILELTQWSFYQNAETDFNIIRISVTIETADTAAAKSFDFNFFKVAGDGNVTTLITFNDVDFAPNGIARNRIYRLDRNCLVDECFIDVSSDGVHAAFDQQNIETVEVIITYEFTRKLQVSGVAGNNVTRLLAGSNITLDPSNGIGEVTINSTGGGGGAGGFYFPGASLTLSDGNFFQVNDANLFVVLDFTKSNIFNSAFDLDFNINNVTRLLQDSNCDNNVDCTITGTITGHVIDAIFNAAFSSDFNVNNVNRLLQNSVYSAGASLTLDDQNQFHVNDANLALTFYDQTDANANFVKLIPDAIQTITGFDLNLAKNLLVQEEILLANNKQLIFLTTTGSDDGTGIKRTNGNATSLAFATNPFFFQALDDKDIKFLNSAGGTYAIFRPINNRFGFNTSTPVSTVDINGTLSVVAVNATGNITTTLDARIDGGDIGLTADPDLIKIAPNEIIFNGVLNPISNLQVFRSTGGTNNANFQWSYNDTFAGFKFRAGTTELFNILANASSSTVSGVWDLKQTGQDFLFRDANNSELFRLEEGAGVVFNEGGIFRNFRVESEGSQNAIFVQAVTNQLGLFTNALSGKGRVVIDQASSSAAIPTLTLDQADVSEGAIDFLASARGTSSTAASDIVQTVRVELNGTVYRLALYTDA